MITCARFVVRDTSHIENSKCTVFIAVDPKACTSDQFCREFARTIPRPFSVRYNPYTQTIEVVKDKQSMETVLNDVRYELDVLQDAIGKQAS